MANRNVIEACELCGGDSAVINSRPLLTTRWRVRECLACGWKWDTYEWRIDPADLPEDLRTRLERLSA